MHGYYLGIKDENNSALDDLEDAKALMEVIMEKILVPCMVHLNKESLYLAKTACVKGREWTERFCQLQYGWVWFDTNNPFHNT